MLKKVVDFYTNISKRGLLMPFILDPVTDKPSITLMFSYITFLLAISSLIMLHFKLDMVVATMTSIAFWLIATVLYMIRKIQKAKFDADDQSFEIEGESENVPKE